MRVVEVPPSAKFLSASMRDIGYSLEMALADIVDNSITAGSSRIDVLADFNGGQPRIGFVDDGHGMSEAELLEAMRPGSQSPLDAREDTDLGRFGLGLKTASFSQCRRLTVVSRTKGATCAAVWDLDYVAEQDKWCVQMPDEPTATWLAEQLGEHGTLVVWEKVDRLVEQATLEQNASHFARRIADASEHLELVFHRFLSGEPGLRRIEIRLNNRKLTPYDPFHSSSTATIKDPAEHIGVGEHVVTVQPYTLPHHGKVSPTVWEKYAGRGGYLKNQGFYVYREKRLIIHGTWFGLARQTELTKLARVRIDMPNGLDSEWKIDVKKASAHPPHVVRERLRTIIETIGASSRRIYTRRGARLTTFNRLPVWSRVQEGGNITYRVDPAHPAFVDFASRLSSEDAKDFYQVLELVGSTVPLDALCADLGGEPEKVQAVQLSDEAFRQAIGTAVERFKAMGTRNQDLVEILGSAEPFRSNWEQTEALLRELDAWGDLDD